MVSKSAHPGRVTDSAAAPHGEARGGVDVAAFGQRDGQLHRRRYRRRRWVSTAMTRGAGSMRSPASSTSSTPRPPSVISTRRMPRLRSTRAAARALASSVHRHARELRGFAFIGVQQIDARPPLLSAALRRRWIQDHHDSSPLRCFDGAGDGVEWCFELCQQDAAAVASTSLRLRHALESAARWRPAQR